MEIKEKIIDIKDYKALDKTLALLKELEMQSLMDKDFNEYVKENITSKIYQNIFEFIKYLHLFIFKKMTYTDDFYDETLISPRVMIKIMRGDCDDFALFGKTILRLVGIRSNYILLAKERGNFSHIALVLPDYNIFFDSTNSKFNYYDSNRYKFYKIIGN